MPQRQFHQLAEESFPERTALWYYRLANVVWLWIAFAIVLGFVQWRVEPTPAASAFDTVVRDQAVLWAFHIEGLIAGLVLFFGLWTYHPRLEILGHCLLAGYIAASAFALLDLTGIWPPITFIMTVSIAVASAFRVIYLVKFTPSLDNRGW